MLRPAVRWLLVWTLALGLAPGVARAQLLIEPGAPVAVLPAGVLWFDGASARLIGSDGTTRTLATVPANAAAGRCTSFLFLQRCGTGFTFNSG